MTERASLVGDLNKMGKEEPWYTDPRSIITTPEETAQGFLQQAVRQFEQASVFVERISQARYKLESSGTTLNDLLEAAETDRELLRLLTAAAGFSEKAINAIGTDEIRRLLRSHILERREELDKDRFIDIILYRYALICGDQLGGVMRNVTGQSATQRIVREIVEKILDRSEDYGTSYLPTGRKRFIPFLENVDDVIESGLSAIQWSHKILVFNMKPKFIDKNVDMILLETSRRIVDRFQLGELLEIPPQSIIYLSLKAHREKVGPL